MHAGPHVRLLQVVAAGLPNAGHYTARSTLDARRSGGPRQSIVVLLARVRRGRVGERIVLPGHGRCHGGCRGVTSELTEDVIIIDKGFAACGASEKQQHVAVLGVVHRTWMVMALCSVSPPPRR